MSDQHLDDLSKKVDAGFARADKKMDEGFAWLDTNAREVKVEMNTRFDNLDAKFDQLTWALLAAAASIIAILIGAILANAL